MTTASQQPAVPVDSAYIANLWEQPRLTIAIFGLQIHSEEAGALWQQSGIQPELEKSLAEQPGLLGMRPFQDGSEILMLQYWRSHEDLSEYARRLPHMSWWKWLVDHQGKGLGFYHEIYQCRTAEAIFERGCQPVGAANIAGVTPVAPGEGLSRERQRRFAEAAEGA